MDKAWFARALVTGLACATAMTCDQAAAAASRTFVASYGSDAHPCSIGEPCRSFGVAVASTSAAGEVIVLDSAGYGPVTIGKSVSIIAPQGVHAGIAVGDTGTGVTVSGIGIDVLLRGLSINGAGTASYGVYFEQGSQLTIEDCEISAMAQSGILALASNGTIRVKDTVLRNNQNDGFQAAGSSLVAVLEHVHAYYNYPNGVSAYAGARVTVSDSVITNSVGGVYATAFLTFVSSVTVTRTVVADCDAGLWVSASAGATARIVADADVLDQVSHAFLWDGSGGTEIIYSPGNNTVGYNNQIFSGGTLFSIGQH